MPDEVTQNFIKQIPLGRLGDVNEIVNAHSFPGFADGFLHHRSRFERERRLLHGIKEAVLRCGGTCFCMSWTHRSASPPHEWPATASPSGRRHDAVLSNTPRRRSNRADRTKDGALGASNNPFLAIRIITRLTDWIIGYHVHYQIFSPVIN